MAVHTNTCTYKCPICSKTFKRSDFLTKHFQQHKGIPTFSCRKCKEKFVMRAERDRHMKTCGTGVLIQMETDDVCQDLDLQPDELTGVKQLIVNPNMVQNLTVSQAGDVSSDGAVCGVPATTDPTMVVDSEGQHLINNNIHLDEHGEPGQTIILLINSEQDGSNPSSILDQNVLQQQLNADPNSYQIIHTYVDGESEAVDSSMIPSNGVSIPEGYEVVLESNYALGDK